MINSVSGSQQDDKAKNSVFKRLMATGAGASLYAGSVVASSYPIKKLSNKSFSISQTLSKDEFKVVDEGLVKTLNDSGLAEKGVRLLDNIDVIDPLYDAIEKSKMPEKLKDFAKSNTVKGQFLKKKNAAFIPQNNICFVPENLKLNGFHELGHAKNFHFSKLAKVLQKGNSLSMALAPLIPLIAIATSPKTEEEKAGSKRNKFVSFFRDNIGKITFGLFTPVLIEEGLASMNAAKMAKKVLTPDLVKKLNKSNALAYSTYVLLALLTSVSAMGAVKIKDKILSNQKAN